MKLGKKHQVVLNFINAVSANDKDRIQSFFTDETRLRHVGGEIVVGQEAIWAMISKLHDKAMQVDWQVDQIHETENGSVETQGKIRYLIDDQWCEYDATGAFEVSGSKVTQWH